ncbi:MrcB family domain-containing protein [Actinoplanes friuliensis]|uniref:MrcB family domain-containing protein n=1 Tax=Actinoplanes friuliensis TaxID=196914 RepID=UPI0009FC893D|nr:DUF3578 domain-containing protein [Actinoplanes friuliensis]
MPRLSEVRVTDARSGLLLLTSDRGEKFEVSLLRLFGAEVFAERFEGQLGGVATLSEAGFGIVLPNGVELPEDILIPDSDDGSTVGEAVRLARRSPLASSIGRRLEHIMATYAMERREKFLGNPLASYIRTGMSGVLESAFPGYVVVGSAGSSGWAETPWIRLWPKAATGPITFPVVFFFRKDGATVFLSLTRNAVAVSRGLYAQKKIDIGRKGDSGKLPSTAEIRRQAGLSRRKLVEHPVAEKYDRGMLDLDAKGRLSRSYEAANLYSTEYWFGDMPDDSEIVDDLRVLLNAQQLLISAGAKQVRRGRTLKSQRRVMY